MSYTPKRKQKPSKLTVFEKANNFASYVLLCTANPRVFRPDLYPNEKYKGDQIIAKELEEGDGETENIFIYLINKLRDTSDEIAVYAWLANDIKVYTKGEAERRLEYELTAISACTKHVLYLSRAKRLCHIKGKKYRRWLAKVVEIQKELKAWYSSEKTRYQEFINN